VLDGLDHEVDVVLASVVKDVFSRKPRETRPSLSVVVNFYNNRREAPNTLYSLTRGYQQGGLDIEYEVIVLDHGSTQPLSQEEVRAFGPEFQYRFVETRSVSPVAAINAACRDAAADLLVVMIDGAHIITPGVIRLVLESFRRHGSPFVATVPLHLGPQRQDLSMRNGYDQREEDRLLARTGWKENGYRLFAASGAFHDDSGGWYGQLFESACFAMRKVDFLSLGGFDERFQSRGGGLVNLDMFQRALVRKDLRYVVLLGEGTFHQFHGGVATNAPADEHPWKTFHEEYVRIRGHPFVRLTRAPRFLGEFPPEAAAFESASRRAGDMLWQKYPAMIE
jgi:hypothetical protein